MRHPGLFVLALWMAILLPCQDLRAQPLPDEPFVLGDGRIVLGGDVSVTASCSHAPGAAACTDDTGFFNFSEYTDSTIRMVRAGITSSVRISRRVSALGDFRFENRQVPHPYALYLRFKPFDKHDFDIQAGRIPSTFGAFPRRVYQTDNLVIGYPLAYQYLTSLRADALPSSPDDLIRMRGRGWLSNFPVGNTTPEAGLPLADAFHLDTGVQAHGSAGWFEAAASLTAGSLSNPRIRDDNGGKHLAGRIAIRPIPGLVAGASASRAPYVASSAAAAARSSDDQFIQLAYGADLEYSRDYYLVRMETVVSLYDIATIEPRLRATATLVEGRYKLTPRLHIAGRFDHLGFSTIQGSRVTTTWDAPVTRWELGGGYSLQRNAQIRLSYQNNRRDGGRVRRLHAVAAQLLYWF